MINHFIELKADIESLKTAFGAALRVGAVAAVDAKKGFRVKWGEDGDGRPFLSPWYPHPESGGATSTWMPLSEGQIVGIMNPGGDPRQGVLLRGGFSDVNPPPSQSLDENVIAFGSVRLTLHRDGRIVVDAGGPVTINSPEIHLGGEGGQPVARVGDLVEVGSGSSAGMWPIVEGSSVVRAVD
ncbi:hypothetical protein GCM10011321_31500 [Youhaiella tibetensis]|uniref:Baseplate assembly protein n=1 Tax=Paradevosia tibetensis TaxID=1447062 RepID=A0A5B9DJN0_9HYPH|nr:phage baseplate assembly protein V [Youhaiella tibetensis]QEE18889.1 baseplate assembly protein [Youhaiella tibetensis]GGF38242.1 hypothetical protein GCM10011321_31500 [Youhaiella tibetensis]